MKIEVRDKVLLFDETVQQSRSRKLSSQWIGPYHVIEVNKVNTTIRKGRKLIKVHVNRLKPFYLSGGDCRESVSTMSILLQMAPHQAVLVLRILLEVALLSAHRDLGYGVERFEDSTDIYYEILRTAT
jgi:hypothetical protein